ncbi:hypothetical protein SDC9_116291 [bioreactor metagenome]|uniref:Glycosyltransferase RgtA/B/C/D-like domain-containing protein n=1 Tax=bioreactor metagenome TaxID=1076179 RepID=A0A645BV44_9ZZZZ
MILADILIAGVIFYICKINNKNWKKFVLLYLLLPFSWYLSSVWGQSDQLSFLFLIIAFILLRSKKYPIWSPLIFAIAVSLKPNCILLILIFLFIWYKQKQTIGKLILGGLIAVFFVLWTVSWFTDTNPLLFSIKMIKGSLIREGLMTANAFNFWYIWFPFPQRVVFETTKYIGLSAKNWGYVLFLITTFLAMKVVKYKKMETIFGAMFIAGFGSWMFMTGMHERYSFFAIVALLFYSIYKKKYLKYFIILSTIYFLAMFHVFVFITKLLIIKDIFAWNVQIVPRILSLINLFIYGRVTYLMLKKNKKGICVNIQYK